jgi:hypothetical protein
MSTRAEVQKELDRIGGLLDDSVTELMADAPPGRIWRFNNQHTMVFPPTSYFEMLMAIRKGVALCTDPECEWCSEVKGLKWQGDRW